MRLSLLLVFFFFLSNLIEAKEVSLEHAQKIARNYYLKEGNVNLENRGAKTLELTINHIEKVGENTSFYIFNIKGQKGFIITSAQDFIRPILGFSDDQNIDYKNLSPSLKYLLDGYSKKIQKGIENKEKASEKVQQIWQNLEISSIKRTSVVENTYLLLTTWNQSPYYNDLCPTNSSGEHAVVGCVAVALAQEMKYYNYPNVGASSSTWEDKYGNVRKKATIYYSKEEYKWYNMPNALRNKNLDLAKLMYHCGHAVRMSWEVESSGSYTWNIPGALTKYFKYDSESIDFVQRKNYTDVEWEQMIRTEIDAKRPIVYSGRSSDDGAGHAWNCDGYKSNDDGTFLYHMNYGWGGYGNGYFALDDLRAGTTPEGEQTYFDEDHQMVIGVKPKADYPETCTANERVISGNEGSFGDGSGNEKYKNNLNCRTIILPECSPANVYLSFTRIDLGARDTLFIYEGTSKWASVIDTITKTKDPQNQYASEHGKGFAIQFITDGSSVGNGWDAEYYSRSCDYIDITKGSGTVNDGSYSCDYQEGLNCYWYIKPKNANHFNIRFTEWDLDNPDHDYVKIYKNTTSTLLYKLKGSDTPPNISVDAEEIIIMFKSYRDKIVAGGWTLEYATNAAAIGDVIPFDKYVKIYPNPFSEDAYIEISNPEYLDVDLQLMDITGRILGKKSLSNISTELVKVSELEAGDLTTGLYLLQVKIEGQSKIYKLVVE